MVLLGYVLTMVMLAVFAFVSGSISVIINVDSMALAATGIALGMIIMFRGRRDTLAIVLRELISVKAEPNRSNEAAHALTGASIIALSFSLLSMCQGLYSGFLQELGVPAVKVVIYASYTVFYTFSIILIVFVPVIFRCREIK